LELGAHQQAIMLTNTRSAAAAGPNESGFEKPVFKNPTLVFFWGFIRFFAGFLFQCAVLDAIHIK